MNQPWTPDEIEKLTGLLRDGLSASQVAGQIGKSRSAVVSYVHRHPGIGFTRTARGRKGGRKADHPMSIAVGRSNKTVHGGKPAKPIKPQNLHATNIQNKKASREADPEFVEKAVSAGVQPRMVALVDLKANECRWPVGDPREASFGFCGHPGFPYCAAHARIAYTAPLARRAA